MEMEPLAQLFILIVLSLLGFMTFGTDGSLSKVSIMKGNYLKKLDRYEYEPTWESLDARPLPTWYDQGKVGIFIHWGVYSVPSFGSEWFWQSWKTAHNPSIIEFMKRNYPPDFSYQDFGPQFTAEFFNATKWTELFKKAGARYVVLTSKHHEGYTLWPSKYSFSWNAQAVGPHRNLVGELADAVRSDSTMRFGLYHSLYEWFNPLWMADKEANLETDDFVQFKTLPELYELVNEYKPEIVWSDGEWEAPDSYWKSKEFLTWLYNESPVRDTVVTNDRWGHETLCNHGGYYTCLDRYNPGVLQPHKWENCFTLDKTSWGYRRNAQIDEYLTPDELIQTIAETVACRGNVLINVGPTKEGIISPIQEERLLQLGEWLEINGASIYDTVPWLFQNDTHTPGVWFTARPAESLVFAIVLDWPKDSILELDVVDPSQVIGIKILGSMTEGTLQWEAGNPGVRVAFPSPLENKSKWAWTLQIKTRQFKS